MKRDLLLKDSCINYTVVVIRQVTLAYNMQVTFTINFFTMSKEIVLFLHNVRQISLLRLNNFNT